MSSITLSLILEKMVSHDKDFRYMAASDLAAELAKDRFRFDDRAIEKRVAEAVLKQLEDSSGDVSALALKCLGLIARPASGATLILILDRLCSQLLAGRQPACDDAALGLRTIVQEVPADRGSELTGQLAPKLVPALAAKGTPTSSAAVDILLDVIARFASELAEPDALKMQLLASLSHLRKRGVQCLAHLAQVLPPASLDGLVDSLAKAKGTSAATAALNLQALAAICRSIGWRFKPYVQPTVNFALEQLSKPGEDQEELLEQALHTLTAVVEVCRSEAEGSVPAVLRQALQSLRYDPNYQVDEEEEAEAEAMEPGSEDEPGSMEEGSQSDLENGLSEEEEYSDDDDVSWKVRNAAAKLLTSCITHQLLPTAKLYSELAGPLVRRFGEREAVVKSDILTTYQALLTQVEAAGKSDALAALETDAPAVVRATVRQIKDTRPKTAKIRAELLGVLAELARIVPAQTGSCAPTVVPSIQAALADTSTTAASLKLAALGFLSVLLAHAAPGQVDVALAILPVWPAVLLATADRYYRVAAAALAVSEAAAPHLAAAAALHVGASAKTPAPITEKTSSSPSSKAAATALMDAATAAAAALRPTGAAQEVKVAALGAAGALLACAGDSLGTDAQGVGVLTQEFAAMPRARTSKRAKVSPGDGGGSGSSASPPSLSGDGSTAAAHSQTTGVVPQLLGQILDKAASESTATAALHALGKAASSRQPLDLSPVLERVTGTVTPLLRQSSRAVHGAALGALRAVVLKQGAALPGPALADAVHEAGRGLSPEDPALAGSALEFVSAAVTVAPEAAGAAAVAAVIPRALVLATSTMLQPATVAPLRSLFAVVSKVTPAGGTPADLCEKVTATALSAGNDAAPTTDAGRQALAQCYAAALSECEAGTAREFANGLAGIVEDSTAPLEHRKFALRCLGELARENSSGVFDPGMQDLLLGSLEDEALAAVAAAALGAATAGAPVEGLPRLLAALRSASSKATKPRLQYQLFRALAEVLRSAGPALGTQQRGDVKNLLLASQQAATDGESAAVLAECLGLLAATCGDGSVLEEALMLPTPGSRALALRAARGAAVALGPGRAAAVLAPFMPGALACLADSELDVRLAAALLLPAAAHVDPVLVEPHVKSIQPLLLRQAQPDDALVRVVNMGPFKHRVDDGLELRKAVFDGVVVLLDSCPGAVDVPTMLDTCLLGLKDAYDVKISCHLLLTRLAAQAPAQVVAQLEPLVPALTATLTTKPKSDAVKQEIDRNDDMLRSCFRAVAALDALPGSNSVLPWSSFMKTVVHSPDLEAKYASAQ